MGMGRLNRAGVQPFGTALRLCAARRGHGHNPTVTSPLARTYREVFQVHNPRVRIGPPDGNQ
jgi:hypothetical protein